MNIDTGETQDWITESDSDEIAALLEKQGYEMGPRELFVFGPPELVAELKEKLQ